MRIIKSRERPPCARASSRKQAIGQPLLRPKRGMFNRKETPVTEKILSIEEDTLKGVTGHLADAGHNRSFGFNKTSQQLGERLTALTGGVAFRCDFDKAPGSPEELMDTGRHNRREWERLEAVGSEQQERILNLVSNLLSDVFQQKALIRYGDAQSSSVKKVLSELFGSPEELEYQAKLLQTEKAAAASLGLSHEQFQMVCGCLDGLPAALLEFMTALVSRSSLLPRSEAGDLSSVLAEMVREAPRC